MKKILSLLLAVLLVLSLLPGAALAGSGGTGGVDVWFSFYDGSQSDFPVLRQKITVEPGTVTDYGWANAAAGTMVGGTDHGVAEGEVTVADALLAAHKAVYGDAFTKATMGTYISGSGYVTKIFGRGSSVSFAVNDRLPVGEKSDGYAMNECVLKDGDDVAFFIYGDGMWGDYLSWFDRKTAALTAGESLTLTLSGYSAMEAMMGTPGSATPELATLGPIEGADIYQLSWDADTSAWVMGGQLGACVTDANGRFTYTFDTAGTYYLTALATVEGEYDDVPIVAPCCVVTVSAATAQWKNFRNSDVNMAITDTPAPSDGDSTFLRWSRKLGSGWSAAPSVQIIVDDCLVVMCGSSIYKLSLADGSTVKTAAMSSSPSFGNTPPTYAEAQNLIIAPLGGGRLQAFDAYTLESKWTFTDELGGQALSPVTCSDGKLYTGFWNSETGDANFVCVDAATGALDWSYTVAGGFYWAGSVAVGDYIVVGTDDGTGGYTGNSRLLVFKKTYAAGDEVAPVASETLTGCGDQRSSMALSDGKVYFTTKGGYLCSAAIDSSTGAISDLKTVSFGAQSTSTPIVYGNYVYFGAGSGISESGSSGNFVIADKSTLAVAGFVGLKGYPQCSMLLSTACEESDGYLYFYSTYNMTPGGVSLVRVKADDVNTRELVEIYDAAGLSNYCVASVICDTAGNLYYKNDSGSVISVGKNAAWATDITADGTTVSGFSSKTENYELVVPRDTQSVTIAASGNADSVVMVNNNLNSAGLDISGGSARATVNVINGQYVHTYTVNVRRASNDTSVNILLSTGNACSGSAPVLDGDTYLLTDADAVTNIWLGGNNGSSVTGFEIIQGASGTPSFTKKSSANTYNGITYDGYYRNGAFTFPVTARLTVTAEDGVTARNFWLVITKDGSYTPDTNTVYVTIADKGSIVVPHRAVTVTDMNYDGRLTVDEALCAAHETFYNGGAEAGYASYIHDTYGLSVSKLWGDTSGNFGYYIDNAMSMGAGDEIGAGQSLNAYITANSYHDADAYACFDSDSYTATAGTAKSVTLTAVTGYDNETYAPIFGAYTGATLTACDSDFNALASSAYTVADEGAGRYSVTFNSAGSYYIVATAAGNAIVPAVASVTVSAYTPPAPSDISVTFRLIGAEKAAQDVNLSDSAYLPDYVTWIETTGCTLARGSTVGDLFKRALDGAGLSCEGLSGGYISSITAPAALGGYKLAEFTNGTCSGWMYTVNGSHPGYGLNSVTLSDGDVVIWHYVNDYRHEVKDWFDDLDFPALGDGTYWSGWLKAEDTAPVKPEEPVEKFPFADAEKHWGREAIEYVWRAKLMDGVDTGVFTPDGTLSRAMLATMLYRLDGEPDVTAENPFTDVEAGKWYTAAAVWACESGITDGSADGLFLPEADISREQIALMLMRYADYKKYDTAEAADLSSFTDAKDISRWALAAMRWANAEGLMTGRAADTLAPLGDATRAEAAAMLMRFVENIAK